MRDLGWWALSPFACGTTLAARHSRCRVLAGPFEGMRYPASFVPRLLFHGAYQVGSFELELHPVIERIVAAAPEAIVNVGGAEGYYAVGLATRLPAVEVIAGRSAWVLMDCEGAEAALADAEAVPWLANDSLLVELHPAADAEIRGRLERRFAATHELKLIAGRGRRASEFDAQLQPIRRLRRIDRELLVAEFRDGSQDWLVATPRAR